MRPFHKCMRHEHEQISETEPKQEAARRSSVECHESAQSNQNDQGDFQQSHLYAFLYG